ncbi:MAG: hypothetical protein IZT60_03730 [Gammaproteobacteria bacterium]|nr:hypothetical protein [Gammaproteobacteria bacterium]
MSGRIAWTSIKADLAGGETVQLRRPAYTIDDPGYGAMQADTMSSPRCAMLQSPDPTCTMVCSRI